MSRQIAMLKKDNFTRIIITDVDSRKGFDVVNIVERYYGFSSILTSRKDIRIQLPMIFGKKVHLLRSETYDQFENDFSILLHQFKENEFIYLPVSEKPTKYFYQYLKKHKPKRIKYLLPEEKFFDLCADKGRFQQFCESLNLPVPKSFSSNDLELLKKNFRPVLLKPRSGQGSVGIRYFETVQDLEYLNNLSLDGFIIQEKVICNKQVTGAFFLCFEGKVLASYQHQRLRTFPPEGGVSVYSKIVESEEISAIGQELLKRMNWTGLAMIEFMFDEPSQQWKIIELNPRIWGSILLSAFSQSELLKKYIYLLIGENIKVKKLKTNSYIRWLYPFDLLAMVKGNINLKTFLRLDLKNTCYINWTYSSFYRSCAYLLYFTFNFSSIRRFLKKINLGCF